MFNSPGNLALLLFGILLTFYFGFNTIAPDLRKAVEFRNQKLGVTGAENIEREEIRSLSDFQKAELELLNKQLNVSLTDQEKMDILKKISGYWYKLDHFSIAGSYAKKVAEIEKSDEAWQIAGTTFLFGLDGKDDLKIKQFCQQEAIFCLEQAISLNTSEPFHQLYLALAYVKLPGTEPMKGIKMMLSMENKFPDFMPLQIQLAELGIQTGQLEKAKARIDKVIAKDVENQKANCLMVQILEKMNQTEEINKYKLHCK